ncbi:MAG TPA: ComF family protein [Burkholderiales bacterium]|nr:ComF family protein [Burkholderiales bacterium]
MRQLAPQQCLLCAAPARSAICSGCEQELPRLPRQCCAVCALPLAGGQSWCGACLKRAPRFERVVAPFAYRFPVDALVHAFKYGGRLALARPLGEALAQAVAREAADAIVPMPLAARRLAERGFNQALEIARVVAAHTGLPLLREACRKVADTPPQAALPWKARAKNVRRAFVCDADLTGLRIAVVDDVLTTGATLEELARVLRRAGAAGVAGWVVARTLPR